MMSSQPTVLGINYAFHDSAACLVVDGRIVAAIEEERLSREKHTQRFPVHAIAASLKMGGLAVEVIDRIAISIDPHAAQAEKLRYAAGLGDGAERFMRYEFERLQQRHVAFWSWYEKTFGGNRNGPAVDFISHHDCHGYGTYAVSGYEHAAILSIDGWGEWTTSWLGEAEGKDVRTIARSDYPHSLGLLYSACTEWLGFIPNYDEGKTMGLAPTGDPSRFFDVVRPLVEVNARGQVVLDTERLAVENVSRGLFDDRLLSALGPARDPDAPFLEHHRDVAASFQLVLEEAVLAMAGTLRRESDARHLVMAGGVALNSVANGRVLREAGFDDLYVMPAAGDAGTAIGAAFVSLERATGERCHYVHDDPYLGTEYDDESIEEAFLRAKMPCRRSADVVAETAGWLAEGRIVAWFQGRMEIGPRALGNRSILADPTRMDMKAKLNAEVKHREAFRPFAPMVPEESASDWFDIDTPSPFMLKVCQVCDEKRDAIPAVTHVDGSARLQTVNASANPRLHALLRQFESLTGCPIVLNTSFNVMGEPVCESPADALRCALGTGIDVLVIGDYVLDKQEMFSGVVAAASAEARKSPMLSEASTSMAVSQAA